MGDSFFIEGLPIDVRYKRIISPILLIFAITNHILPVFGNVLDYPHKDFITLLLLAFGILFSFGSKFAETLVIALAAFEMASLYHDFGVFDISLFRVKLFYGSAVILIISGLFGKVSVANIFKKQLGLG